MAHGSRHRRAVAALAATLLVLPLAACSDDEGEDDAVEVEPVPPAQVALAAEVDGPVRIGVVVSSVGSGAEGTDVLPLAQGAMVAQRRLADGGVDVEVLGRDDRGTAEGAVAVVEELVDAGVSGIVLGTSGSHTTAALERAAEAGVPVVAPYLGGSGLPATTWSTAPSTSAVDAGMGEALAAVAASRPLVLTIGDAEEPQVEGARAATFGADGVGAAVTAVADAVDERAIDSVVLAGAAADQARFVQGIQTVADVPVVLTPDALSPVFADVLADSGGVLSAPFLTVGPDAGDATTLAEGAAGESAAAYFAALRSLTADTDAVDVLGRPFDVNGADADLASHDAVVALVRAVEAAGSGAPADVAGALPALWLDPGDGLAGPALSFATQQALPDDAVVALTSTTQDPGVRSVVTTGAPETQHLYWLAVPTGA
ncbi:ABC transporter substrate-binding protein [Nocardioides zeae]|uniref:ABC-type branched-subunit amino acid transport system substrate-binding protein n=1 Tax=Nocardioides zeae TaxID=1457234 RepID=A0AAJ1X3J1_9ACTN|nr:ABC transporter substrate-binding protein [Nocardioides zeae]MDQ1104587.1 ABC-type branched-subunit amino acid transport system substrate-binding protein [Nocardioides zeae]